MENEIIQHINPNCLGSKYCENHGEEGEVYYSSENVKLFFLSELKALKEELIGLDQNILLSVQQGKISTGRAIELQQDEIIKAFAKRGV